MWKDYLKIINKQSKNLKNKLFDVIDNIEKWNLDWLEYKKLKWYNFLFRVRIWKIRIIFEKDWEDFVVKKIWYRWDVY